jgi:uncharacterized SAM-binding protein YcdF (DUF218 family)
MPRINPRTARSRGFVEPPRRLGFFMQLVLFVWFLIRFAVAAAVTAAFGALALLLWFGFTMPEAPADAAAKTDAIVVLTGGEDRLETAFALLQKGLASRMFVTGVDRKVTKPELLKRLGDPPAELANRIELGFRAADTRGNATETAAWFNSQNMKSMRLVTGNYHMRRSVLLFRRAMPDAEIVQHPVVPKGLAVTCRSEAGAACVAWWSQPETGRAVARELIKYGAALFYISTD